MKRFAIILAVLALAFSAQSYAQNIKGTWTTSDKIPFVGHMYQDLSFKAKDEGEVVNKLNVNIDFSLFGLKVAGNINFTVSGDFKYDGNTLYIEWDGETGNLHFDDLVITLGSDPEKEKEIKDYVQQLLDKITSELESEFDGEEYYDSVTFKDDKLILADGDDKTVFKKK